MLQLPRCNAGPRLSCLFHLLHCLVLIQFGSGHVKEPLFCPPGSGSHRRSQAQPRQVLPCIRAHRAALLLRSHLCSTTFCHPQCFSLPKSHLRPGLTEIKIRKGAPLQEPGKKKREKNACMQQRAARLHRSPRSGFTTGVAKGPPCSTITKSSQRQQQK